MERRREGSTKPGGEFSVEEKGVRRQGGVLGWQRTLLTFVRKRISENINVAAGAAEC